MKEKSGGCCVPPPLADWASCGFLNGNLLLNTSSIRPSSDLSILPSFAAGKDLCSPFSEIIAMSLLYPNPVLGFSIKWLSIDDYHNINVQLKLSMYRIIFNRLHKTRNVLALKKALRNSNKEFPTEIAQTGTDFYCLLFFR